MKFSLKLFHSGMAVLTLAWAGLHGSAVDAAENRPREVAGTRIAPPLRQAETEVIRLRPGKLPYVSLTADIFYRLLVAEIAAQRGLYGPAADTMMNLARGTSDPRLARRALEFQLAGGNLSGALDAARLWARLAPADSEAGSTELALAAANGQTKGLAQALRQRIDSSHDKAAAISQALSVLSRLKDKRMAFEILDEALSDPVRKLPAARIALADVADATGNDERATQEARAALAADPKSEAAAQRVLEYGAKVDPSRARNEVRDFIARYPDARKLRLMLASQLADSGDYNGAQAELAAMSRRSPEDFDLLFMQAQIAYQAGRLSQASTLLQQYLEVQNQRQRAAVPGATDAGAAATDAHVLLARIAEDERRYEEAIIELSRIDDPTMRYSVQMRQAALRAKQGLIAQALTMVDEAVPDDDDERVLGVLTKAQILREVGQVDSAVSLLETADKALPNTAEIKYELAMLYERQGRLSDLERLLRQVIELDPERAHAYNALGYTLADHNQRLPEALELVTRALELAPTDPFILDSMGWVKFRLGDNVAAVNYLKRAYAQLPEPDIGVHLGEVLWAQGMQQEAIELWREALRKDANNITLLNILKRLGVKF